MKLEIDSLTEPSEEINRKIVSYGKICKFISIRVRKKIFKRMAELQDRTFVTIQSCRSTKRLKGDNESNILDKLKNKKEKHILLSCHREENIDIEKIF